MDGVLEYSAEDVVEVLLGGKPIFEGHTGQSRLWIIEGPSDDSELVFVGEGLAFSVPVSRALNISSRFAAIEPHLLKRGEYLLGRNP